MKRPILFIAGILFLINYGFATQPVNRDGSVTVKIDKHLEFEVVERTIRFYYNEADGYLGHPGTTTDSYNTITVKSNLNWTFTIVSKSNDLTNPKTTMTIPANLFKFNIESIADGNVDTPSGFQSITGQGGKITGSKNAEFSLNWRTDPLISGNLFAGEYKVDLDYTLSEQ